MFPYWPLFKYHEVGHLFTFDRQAVLVKVLKFAQRKVDSNIKISGHLQQRKRIPQKTVVNLQWITWSVQPQDSFHALIITVVVGQTQFGLLYTLNYHFMVHLYQGGVASDFTWWVTVPVQRDYIFWGYSFNRGWNVGEFIQKMTR